MDKTPIFSPLGPRYRFLITRKVISGQKYYRNAKELKKSVFFAKKFFHQPANIGKSAKISKCVFSKMVWAISVKLIICDYALNMTNDIRSFIGIGRAILEKILIFCPNCEPRPVFAGWWYYFLKMFMTQFELFLIDWFWFWVDISYGLAFHWPLSLHVWPSRVTGDGRTYLF